MYLYVVWVIFNLVFDIAQAAESRPYFAGSRVENSKPCGADLATNCQKLCPGDRLSYCFDSSKQTLCYCHEKPEAVAETPCDFISTTPAGDMSTVRVRKNNLGDSCLKKSKQGFRSRVDVFACPATPKNICLFVDHLDEIEVIVPFGGKTVENVCNQPFEDFCKAFCPDNYVSCRSGLSTACYCRTDPPTDANGFTCSKYETARPSDAQLDGTTPIGECHNAATSYAENIEVHLCKKEGSTGLACILLDKIPEPTTTTTTTTEVPTTTTTTTTTEEPTSTTTMETTEDPSSAAGGGGGSSSLGGSGRVSCKICKGGFLLSFIVCPILCLIFQIIRVVVYLLKKTLFRAIKNLLNFVASTLDDVVGAIGGLLD